MGNHSTIHDYDSRIDAPRHRTVAVCGAMAALTVAAWAASYTVIPFGIAIFSLFNIG